VPTTTSTLLGLFGVVVIALSACGSTTTERLSLPPLKTVQRVDLKRYQGTWYEIASFPQRFQKGCTNTTARYTIREDQEVDVLNRCLKSGKEDTAKGRARVVDTTTNAKLEVSFFWPFWGDYWIIDLGPRYEYAVVGHPGRDYLWILSRTPKMKSDVYGGIIARLKDQGYQVGRLRKTHHGPG